MLDGKKNQADQDLGEETDYTEETGSLGGESEQKEDVTDDETMIEDLEEEDDTGTQT